MLLLTERSFSRATCRMARQVHSTRRERAGAADAAVMTAIAGVRGTISVGALVEATGLRGVAFRTVIRRIAAGDIALVGNGLITHAARVSPAVPAEAV